MPLNLRYPASKQLSPIKQSMQIAGLKDHMQNVVRGMLKNKKRKLNLAKFKQPLGGSPLKLSLANSIRGKIDSAGMGMFKSNTPSGRKVKGIDISENNPTY